MAVKISMASLERLARNWPQLSRSFALRYGVALLSTVLATWARLLLDPLLGQLNPFSITLFAVLLTAWFGGTRAAIVAVALGVVFTDYFLLPPRGSFALKGAVEYVNLLLYLVVALGIAVLGGRMQAARLGGLQRLHSAQETLSRTEERLRLTLRSSGIAVWTWNIVSDIVEVDEHCSRLFGLPAGQFPRTVAGFAALLHPEDRARVQQQISDAVEHGAEYSTEFRVQQPEGAVRCLAARAKVHRSEDGRPRNLSGVCWDVTERRRAEETLHDTDKKLKEELQRSKERADEIGKLNDLVEILQSCQTTEEACRILENLVPTMLRCRAGALCLTSPSRNDVETAAKWGDVPGTRTTFRPDECWALRRGKMHQVTDASSPLRCAHVARVLTGGYLCIPIAAQGETLGILYLEGPIGAGAALPEQTTALMETLARHAVAIGERISLAIANLRLREQLRNLSIRDPLTGLFNRRYMEEFLEREVSLAIRKSHNLAVVMCDLDHFKRFNDTFGHDAGDLVLREVANVLGMKVRASDLACRFGGEEFMLVLQEVTLPAALERMESIRKEIKSLALRHKNQSLGSVTMSAGVAMCPANGVNGEELLKVADRALYRAKQEGRDRVVAESPFGDVKETPKTL